MKRHEELVHEFDRDGFHITLYLANEDMDPRDSFDEEIEREHRTFERIENGSLLWFMAHVVAEKDGYEGHDYLGACCYESVSDFTDEPQGYYQDMVSEAMRMCANERSSAEQKRAFC